MDLDDLPCAVLRVSRVGIIEAVNATVETWTGLSGEKLIGMLFGDIVDEGTAPPRLRAQAHGVGDVEMTIGEEAPSGSRVVVLVPKGPPAPAPAERLTFLGGANPNAYANALLDTIFETAPIGLGVWDKDLRFVRVNARLAEINGVPPEAHIGKRPHEILPEIANIDEIYRHWQKIFETGTSWNGVEVKGATPAAPGLLRTWNEDFYPIKVEGEVVGIGAVVEETTERNRYIERVNSLVKELNHRCKNLLSIVLAIARQTAREASPQDFIARFTSRIQGLVASHDLLVRDDWKGVALSDLVNGQLAPFEERIGQRVRVSGPGIRLRPPVAQSLGMAVHELATNAVKYGALSNAMGDVRFSWEFRMSGAGASSTIMVMRWQESGGPLVDAPTREGFGQLVIGKLLEASTGGTTTIDFAPEGVIWTLTAPLNALVE